VIDHLRNEMTRLEAMEQQIMEEVCGWGPGMDSSARLKEDVPERMSSQSNSIRG
jgi:hypothetical protein